MRASRASLLCLSLSVACAPTEPFQARFAVRGRWPGERSISYRLEPAGGPLAAAEFRQAIEDALEQWHQAGAAEFHPARADEPAAVLFAWKRAAHGACTPFGADPSVAHSGPVGPGTFVHFDAERDWDGGAVGLSLHQAALHEVGHVLGLDHSPDEQAVMYPEPSPARALLAASDLAGIHALYGGGTSASGDLVVTRSTGAQALVLPAVAPRALSGWALFDSDGDGDDEVLVWRTDVDGYGALWSYHFGPGPVLERSEGPAYGVSLPGAELAVMPGEHGERLLLLVPRQGAVQARVFDARGVVQTFAGEPPAVSPSAWADAAERRGDLDGDGTLETIRRRD